MRRWLLPLAAALLLSAGCRGADLTTDMTATPNQGATTATPTPPGPQVVLNGTVFTVEIAATPEQRVEGLMYRSSLDPEGGMLFIYPADDIPGFWMRNMLIPLDIVWMDAEGVVAGVTANVPPAPQGSQPLLYYPPRPIRYVLEINAGLAKVLGIGPGTRVTFRGIP